MFRKQKLGSKESGFMKMKRILASIFIVVIVFGLTACGAKADRKESAAPQETTSTSDNGFMDANTSMNQESKATNTDIKNNSQKLIKKVDLTLETIEYDQLISFLSQKIIELSGYVEESQSFGNSLNSKRLRSANLIARIPSNRLDEFVDLIGENTTIVAKNESAKDVTSEYVDTQSRQKALEIQQERLFALLEKAEKMEDIITLESRISDVTYELERYTSTLRSYDNLVEYSTVTIQISEVERVTSPEPTNTWEKMKNGLSDSLYNIKEGFQDFVVWFVSNFLYLILWAIIIVIVVIVTKKGIKIYNKNYRYYGNQQNYQNGNNSNGSNQNENNQNKNNLGE